MNFQATVANRPVAVLRRLVPAGARQPVFFFLNKLLGRMEPELDLVPKLTERKRTAIDIGASSGYYSYVMAKHFARVEAFEPIPPNTRNLEDYGSPRIRVHHVALGNESGRVKIHLPIVDGTGSYGTASVSEPSKGKFEVLDVESKRLDEFGFEEVDLIKIDVEGHEVEVLRGGLETIKRNRPVLIMEISNRNKDRVEEIFAEIGGYRPHILAEGGGLKPLAGGLKDPEVRTVNFIYKPL